MKNRISSLLATLGLSLAAGIVGSPALALQQDPSDDAGHAGHAGHDHAQDPQTAPATRTQPWPAEIVALAESLPVQEGGRIKPLHSFAGFSLLRLNHKRSIELSEDEKLSAVEWFLDVLFFPEQASGYAMFAVDDAAVIEAIGLEHAGKKKRDRYSLDELSPGWQRAMELGESYRRIELAKRSTVQQGVFQLAENLHFFVNLAEFAAAFVAPVESAAEEPEWLTWGELSMQASRGEPVADEHIAVLNSLQELLVHRDDPEMFASEFKRFHGQLVGLAEARGEYGKIAKEVSYYKADYLTNALAFFLLAFVLSAIVWMAPRNRWLPRGAMGVLLVGLGLLCTAITLRCIIRGRPPVSTLYETLLFVTACAVIVGVVIEFIDRKRIALSVSAALGALGVFLAFKFEMLEKRDTMPSLVAVLDTNFWLATHVTTITIGYAAGMLAAFLASVYIVVRLVAKNVDRSFLKSLSRVVYGVVCFGLIFSTVGTILGGVWANDSWGRFWGWDPKENGALLICLVEIAILHARMGGYLRELGICVASAALGCVVAFSWFGVNLLGVGLHSYGFADGLSQGLLTYYGIQGSIVVLGLYVGLRESITKRAVAEVRARQAGSGQAAGGERSAVDPSAPSQPSA